MPRAGQADGGGPARCRPRRRVPEIQLARVGGGHWRAGGRAAQRRARRRRRRRVPRRARAERRRLRERSGAGHDCALCTHMDCHTRPKHWSTHLAGDRLGTMQLCPYNCVRLITIASANVLRTHRVWTSGMFKRRCARPLGRAAAACSQATHAVRAQPPGRQCDGQAAPRAQSCSACPTSS